MSRTGQSDPPFLHRLDLILLTADDDVDENALFCSEGLKKSDDVNENDEKNCNHDDDE